MKALMHIGIPKSGTSSIQAFLAMNKDALAGHGALYAPFNPNFGSQFEFAVTALEACGDSIAPDLERRRLGFTTRADQTAYVAAYRAFLDRILHAAKASRFLGSSEHLHAWLTRKDQIAALDSFLCARFEAVQYLVYLRPQEELITSTYSEAIRRGATHDLATHLKRNAQMNHWTRLKSWLEVIGPDRLSIRLTCRDALTGGDLLQDFCQWAQITPDGIAQPARVNPALSAREIALRRRLNRVLPVLGQDGAPHLLYRMALRGLAPLLVHRQERLRLSAAQLSQVRACNAASNEKIRKRFFRHRTTLF